MLILALSATLIGFVLLVVGLITGTVWLAVACIAVCLVGLVFLVGDIIASARRSRRDDGTADAGGGFGFGDADHHANGATGATGDDDTAAVPLSPDAERQALWQGVVSPRPDTTPGGTTAGEGDSADGDAPGAESGAAESASASARAGGAAPSGRHSALPQQSSEAPDTPVPSGATPSGPATGERGYADYLRSIGADELPSATADTPSPPPTPTGGADTVAPESTETTGPLTPIADRGEAQSGRRRKIDPLDPSWRPPTG